MNAETNVAIEVALTLDEWEYARSQGKARNASAVTMGRVDEKEQHHIIGAIGELAVAKEFGVSWEPTIGQIDAKDVGGFQVRSTTYAKGHLILQPRGENTPGDDANEAFILCVVAVCEGGSEGVVVSMVGWLWGWQGMRPTLWSKDKRGHWAWWVPQHCLEVMADLDRAKPRWKGP